jgi:hypothetical protein
MREAFFTIWMVGLLLKYSDYLRTRYENAVVLTKLSQIPAKHKTEKSLQK